MAGVYIDWIDGFKPNKKRIKKDLVSYEKPTKILTFDVLSHSLNDLTKELVSAKQDIEELAKKYDSLGEIKEKEVLNRTTRLVTDYRNNCLAAINEARTGNDAIPRLPNITFDDTIKYNIFVTKSASASVCVAQKVNKIIINKIKRKGSPFVDKLEKHYVGVKELVLENIYLCYAFDKKGMFYKLYFNACSGGIVKTFHSSSENGQVCLGGLSSLFSNINCYSSDFNGTLLNGFTKKLVELFETINCDSPYPINEDEYARYKDVQPKFWLPTIIDFYNRIVLTAINQTPAQTEQQTEENQPQEHEAEPTQEELDDFYDEQEGQPEE
jgi:hypothetical protein